MPPAFEHLLGKRVLVGVTCVDPDGEPVEQFQADGVVGEVGEDAILLVRVDGSTFGLPPAPELLDTAEPGVYTLSDGRTVENPDFLAVLTITIDDPTSLADLRAHGFLPPDP